MPETIKTMMGETSDISLFSFTHLTISHLSKIIEGLKGLLVGPNYYFKMVLLTES